MHLLLNLYTAGVSLQLGHKAGTYVPLPPKQCLFTVPYKII